MKHSPKTICQSFTCTNWLSKLVSILQFWEQEFRIYGAIHNLNILGYLEGSEWCLLLVLNLLPVCKLSRISKNIDKATCRVQSRVSTMHIFSHNAMRCDKIWKIATLYTCMLTAVLLARLRLARCGSNNLINKYKVSCKVVKAACGNCPEFGKINTVRVYC